MFNFFQNIFGAVISAMASVIIAVGLVSVPEIPKQPLQIEQPREEIIVDKVESRKADQKNEKQSSLSKPIISEKQIKEIKQSEKEYSKTIPKQETTTAEKRRGMEETKKHEIQTLLQEFIDNPPRESFLSLCDKANQVEIPNTEKTILSSDRSTTITVPYTMFDVMRCEFINNQHYSLIDITQELFQWDKKDDDSDNLRIRKIEYNKQIRKVLASGKFVIVEKTVIPHISNLTKHLITEGKEYSLTFLIYNPIIRAVGLLGNPNSAILMNGNADISFFGETLFANVSSSE